GEIVRRALLLTLLLLTAVEGRAEWRIEHLEPAFWWAGMQHPVVEILVHGERIAELEPEIRYPGVTLANVHRTENPNYLFLELSVAPEARPGRFEIRFERAGETAIAHEYELRAREAGSAERRGFDPS